MIAKQVKLKAARTCLWCKKRMLEGSKVWEHSYLCESKSYIHIECRPEWKASVETTVDGRTWLRDFVTVEESS